MEVSVTYGNHEELYGLLRTGEADLILNDQRRAFSDEYVNLLLTTCHSYIEVSAHSPLARMERISPPELENIPCVLVASETQRETEQEYYHDVVGFHGGIFICGKSGGNTIDGDRPQGLSPCGGNRAGGTGRNVYGPHPAGAGRGAHFTELLCVLEKGQFRMLCGGICRFAESTI